MVELDNIIPAIRVTWSSSGSKSPCPSWYNSEIKSSGFILLPKNFCLPCRVIDFCNCKICFSYCEGIKYWSSLGFKPRFRKIIFCSSNSRIELIIIPVFGIKSNNVLLLWISRNNLACEIPFWFSVIIFFTKEGISRYFWEIV